MQMQFKFTATHYIQEKENFNKYRTKSDRNSAKSYQLKFKFPQNFEFHCDGFRRVIIR